MKSFLQFLNEAYSDEEVFAEIDSVIKPRLAGKLFPPRVKFKKSDFLNYVTKVDTTLDSMTPMFDNVWAYDYCAPNACSFAYGYGDGIENYYSNQLFWADWVVQRNQDFPKRDPNPYIVKQSSSGGMTVKDILDIGIKIGVKFHGVKQLKNSGYPFKMGQGLSIISKQNGTFFHFINGHIFTSHHRNGNVTIIDTALNFSERSNLLYSIKISGANPNPNFTTSSKNIIFSLNELLHEFQADSQHQEEDVLELDYSSPYGGIPDNLLSMEVR